MFNTIGLHDSILEVKPAGQSLYGSINSSIILITLCTNLIQTDKSVDVVLLRFPDVIVDDLKQKSFSASFNWVGTHDTVDYLEPRVPEAGNGISIITIINQRVLINAIIA